MRTALHRYANQITRVEVHLSDENGGKSGRSDKRCLIEARPAGHPPLTVSNDAVSLEVAFNGAAKKMQHLLESVLGQSHNHKGGASIQGEISVE